LSTPHARHREGKAAVSPFQGRSLIAENHQITFEEIVEQLDRRFGLKFDRDYVTKLATKILVEGTKRADRLMLNCALTGLKGEKYLYLVDGQRIGRFDFPPRIG
jgi:hypothetical protein